VSQVVLEKHDSMIFVWETVANFLWPQWLPQIWLLQTRPILHA